MTGLAAGPVVLVTRPVARAQALADGLRRAGAQPLVHPGLEIVPLELDGATRALLERPIDLAVFVSPTAVEEGLRQLRSIDQIDRIAAVGPGTARALEASGIRTIVVPERPDSEGLLATDDLMHVSGAVVAIFRGRGGRELLGTELTRRGAQVHYIECYERRRPSDLEAIIERWRGGRIDAAVFTSSEALDHYACAARPALSSIAATPIFVPHDRIAHAAGTAGFTQVVVTPPGDAAIIARLVRFFGLK